MPWCKLACQHSHSYLLLVTLSDEGQECLGDHVCAHHICQQHILQVLRLPTGQSSEFEHSIVSDICTILKVCIVHTQARGCARFRAQHVRTSPSG